MANAGHNEYEKMEWTAMKCLLKKSNTEMYDALGINIDKVYEEAEKFSSFTSKKRNKDKSAQKHKATPPK